MAIILYDLCAGDSQRRLSPHCWKARMALAHKGLTFESRATPFTKIKGDRRRLSPLDLHGGLGRSMPAAA